MLHRVFAVLSSLAVLMVVAAAASIASPTPFWQVKSKSGSLQARLSAPVSPVPIGTFQRWVLSVENLSGDPVNPARFEVQGGMPGHGHGLPSQPRVTKYLGDGQYVVEGLKFSMAGQWILQFHVSMEGGHDFLEFEILIDY